MKILHIELGRKLFGGARQVLHLVDGLQLHGVQSILVSPRGSAIASAAPQGVVVEEIAASGDLDLRVIGDIRRAIDRYKPDLVHIHSRGAAEIFGVFAARSRGIPVVTSRRVDSSPHPLVANFIDRNNARVIAISQAIAEVLMGKGIAATKLRVVRSAVDFTDWRAPAGRQRFLPEFGLSDDAITIGIVAQLIRRKGHHVLFEALHRANLPANVRVIVFGRGKLEDRLRREAPSSVIFAGFRSDLPLWLGNLDLVVHPALAEGLGISLMQASAAGVPIVASAVGGIPEVVRPDINGVLVSPSDAQELADVLTSLVSDPARRHALGAGGRTLMEQADFSVAQMVVGNLAVYREVLR